VVCHYLDINLKTVLNMKTVYIVRHAKSSWDNFNLSDHDRPLQQVGIKKTKKIIDFLKNKRTAADLIISSSAVRAFETAKLIATGIGYPIQAIVKNADLFQANEDDIYNELLSIDDDKNSVMIIAHNPTLTDFVNNFVAPQIDNLPTTGIVRIDFDTNTWT
jgi:phosphohistidine phosphatase